MVSVDVVVAFFTIAAIIVLSFLGDLVSKRALLPNAILLIVVGIIFGPVLSLFDRSILLGVVPFLAPLTIAFIGFEVGLGLDIYEVLAHSKRAVLLSVLGFGFSTCFVGIFLHFAFDIGLDYAFLMASAWGGVSTMTVNVVCKHLGIGKEAVSTLTISSLVDDIVVLVVALTLLNYITLGGLGIEQVGLNLVRNLCVSVFVGVIIGVAWLYALYFCRQAEFVYSFVLAAVLGVYSGTEMLGGTGGIAIFIFGLILGNCRSLANSLKLRVDSERLFDLKELIRKFHSELAFILTTFFFVFLGLIYMWTGWVELLYGVVISALLHGSRLLTVRIGILKSGLIQDFPAIGLIVGKGAASAAMSTLPLAYGLSDSDMLTSVALNVILLTNVFSVILPIAFAKK